MYVKLVRDRKSFDQLQEDWKKLANACEDCSIFMQWEYLQTCLNVSDVQRLFVITVYNDEERLVAVLPLFKDQVKLFGVVHYKVLRHISNLVNCSEYGGCLTEPGNENSAYRFVISLLQEKRKEWDLLWLPKQASWNPKVKLFAELIQQEQTFWLQTRPIEFSFISEQGSSEEYLSNLSTKVRAQIKREQRDVFQRGALQLLQCDTIEKLPAYLQELFRLHHLRWSAKGQSGVFIKRPNEKKFYELFAPHALKNDWLRLFLLKDGDKAVAAKIGFTCNRVCYSLQGGFDPDSIKGAGNALLYRVIESSIEQDKVFEYDFLGGVSQHKSRWAAKVRQGGDYLLGRKSIKSFLIKAAGMWPGGRGLH